MYYPIEGIYINYDYTIKLILLLSSAYFCAILNTLFTKSISFLSVTTYLNGSLLIQLIFA